MFIFKVKFILQIVGLHLINCSFFSNKKVSMNYHSYNWKHVHLKHRGQRLIELENSLILKLQLINLRGPHDVM